MNPKIKKLAKDIDKTRAKIKDMQGKLRVMEQQKVDMENEEYISMVRDMGISPEQLADFLKGYKVADDAVAEQPVAEIEQPEDIVVVDDTASDYTQEDAYDSTPADAKPMTTHADVYGDTVYTPESNDAYRDTPFTGSEDTYYEG